MRISCKNGRSLCNAPAKSREEIPKKGCSITGAATDARRAGLSATARRAAAERIVSAAGIGCASLRAVTPLRLTLSYSQARPVGHRFKEPQAHPCRFRLCLLSLGNAVHAASSDEGACAGSMKAIGERSVPSSRARLSNAACFFLGMKPPVPPLSTGRRQRRTVVSVVPAALATGRIPPRAMMIELAGSQ